MLTTRILICLNVYLNCIYFPKTEKDGSEGIRDSQ